MVKSVDLMPTLLDLAGVTPPKGQRLGGESLRPLLLADAGGDGRGGSSSKHGATQRKKTWALTQWPRRPSCVYRHGCEDGSGNPYEADPDRADMGYRLRTSDGWAYVCWFRFDWGTGGDPDGKATAPLWDQVVARELYSHVGDSGDAADGERFEWDNLAYDDDQQARIHGKGGLHDQLVAAVKTGLVKPIADDDGSHDPPHQSSAASSVLQVNSRGMACAAWFGGPGPAPGIPVDCVVWH